MLIETFDISWGRGQLAHFIHKYYVRLIKARLDVKRVHFIPRFDATWAFSSSNIFDLFFLSFSFKSKVTCMKIATTFFLISFFAGAKKSLLSYRDTAWKKLCPAKRACY